MRHFLRLPLAVFLLAGGVVTPALGRLLVAAASLPQRHRPPCLGAPVGAVPVAVVAPTAEEEDLPAGRPGADDEAKRVHVPGVDRQELDVRDQA